MPLPLWTIADGWGIFPAPTALSSPSRAAARARSRSSCVAVAQAWPWASPFDVPPRAMASATRSLIGEQATASTSAQTAPTLVTSASVPRPFVGLLARFPIEK